MKLADLLATYEERARVAEAAGSSAPVANLYRLVLAELRQVDGVDAAARWMDTGEAADILGVTAKTVRRWLADGQRFPNARKPGGADGEWRIPAADVYGIGRENGSKVETTVPKLYGGQHG